MPLTARTQAFITKWQVSGASELANAQSFINDLCALLEVDAPQPKTGDEPSNAYVFNKTIPSVTDSANFIDCYKRASANAPATQASLLPVDGVDTADATVSTPSTRTWPAELPAQAAALTELLATLTAPAYVETIAAHFEGKRTKKRLDDMTKLLETLQAVGRARKNNHLWSGA